MNGYNYGPGILQLPFLAPAHNFRMALPHIVPGSIKPGAGVLAGITLANVWVNDDQIDVDYEIINTHIGVTYGFSERFGFGVYLDQRNYFGGILDGLIQGVHDIFNLRQNERDEVDRGLTRIVRYDTDGTVIRANEDLTMLDNNGIGFIAQYIFLAGGRRSPSMDLSTGLRYGLDVPTGLNEHTLDWNVGLGVVQPLSDAHHLYGNLVYTIFDQTEILDLRFRRTTLSGMLAGSWSFSERSSMLLQYMVNEGMIEDLGEFDEVEHEISLGFKWGLPDGDTLELAIIENIIIYDNSPDLGFHLAYGKQL